MASQRYLNSCTMQHTVLVDEFDRHLGSMERFPSAAVNNLVALSDSLTDLRCSSRRDANYILETL